MTQHEVSLKIADEVKVLIDDLLDDYDKGRDIDTVETFMPSNKEAIIKIIDQLQRIIFPGYFKNENFKVYTTRNSLSMNLEDVVFNLSKQIAIVLKYLPAHQDKEELVLQQDAHKITLEFMKRLTDVRAMIQTDLEAAYEGDPAAFNKPEIIYSYPGLYAIMVNRLAHELYSLGVPIIPRIMTEHAHTLTGIDIHPGATIGKYFFIDHGTGIVVGETTVIGDNVKIYQGVTLGALSTRGGQKLFGSKRHPTIENNVTIYSGASILGGETIIGHCSVVGGNAFITASIPPGTRVSIKNQELEYRTKGGSSTEEVKQSEAWEKSL